MQPEDEVKIDYIAATGPEGLWEVLNSLLEKVRTEKITGPAEFYIRYILGSQTSLIKVDMNAEPVQFWYYDLLGRPVTKAVRETIGRFLWEKCGEKERFEPIKED